MMTTTVETWQGAEGTYQCPRTSAHIPVPTFLSSNQTKLSRSGHRAYTFYENIF